MFACAANRMRRLVRALLRFAAATCNLEYFATRGIQPAAANNIELASEPRRQAAIDRAVRRCSLASVGGAQPDNDVTGDRAHSGTDLLAHTAANFGIRHG